MNAGAGKKVWIFNHYGGPPSGMPCIRHYQFSRYLIRAGYDVTIFAASSNHITGVNLVTDGRAFISDDSGDVPYVYIKTRSYEGNGKDRILNMIDYYRGLFKATKPLVRPDVILGSSVHPLACAAAIRLARRYGCRSICEIRDLWPESIIVYKGISRNNILMWMLYKLEKWIYTEADQLIFTMPGGIKYIMEHHMDKDSGGTVDLGKVHYLNNGIDLAGFWENVRSYVTEDADLEDPLTYKIVYTGSIRMVNNLRKLVDAAQIVGKEEQNVIFIVYGDGDERITLEQFCREKQISNVKFKGAVKKQYVPYILTKCDAAYIGGTNNPLCAYGSSANKQFDYFAAGLPIISNVSNWKDLIEEYKCGFIVREDDIQVLAENILRCFRLDEFEYQKMRQNALQAAADYDIAVLSRRLIEMIEE